MTETNNLLKTISQSFTTRMLVIGVLALLMLIPLMMIQEIIHERNNRYQSTLSDISATWGKYQTLQGPILIVPYVDHVINMNTVTDKNGETKTVSRDVFNDKTAVILPSDLNIDVNLQEERRHRGIYKTLVYTADLSISGSFDYTALVNDPSKRRRYEWDKAWVLIGLTDTKAITQNSHFSWDDNAISLNPGTGLTKFISNGFSAPLKNLDLDELNTEHKFKLQLSAKGDQGFQFAPLGEKTKAHITSTWPHPSFQGAIPPNDYETTDDGFSAKWEIPQLARNYPQHWILQNEQHSLDKFTTGVDLFEPVSLYSKTLRSVKYGILFVIMTFLSLLIFEMASKTRLHIMQYIVIGTALSLFYLILLSLAEHIAFITAYLTASGITISIISLYALALLKTKKLVGIIFSLLVSLYTVLYVLLQMEDYALLVGTGLLLIMIVAIMYVTRHLQNTDSQ